MYNGPQYIYSFATGEKRARLLDAINEKQMDVATAAPAGYLASVLLSRLDYTLDVDRSLGRQSIQDITSERGTGLGGAE